MVVEYDAIVDFSYTNFPHDERMVGFRPTLLLKVGRRSAPRYDSTVLAH